MFHVLVTFVALLGQVPPETGQGLGSHQTLRFKAGGDCTAIAGDDVFAGWETLVVSLAGDKTVFIRTRDAETVGSDRSTPFALAYAKDGSRMLLVSEAGFVALDANSRTRLPFKDVPPEQGYSGLTTEERNGKLNVVALAPKSPVAMLGSIHVGDELVGVGDGLGGTIASVIGSSPSQVRKLLIGPVGTPVRLKVIPKGKTKAEIYSIRRQPIRTNGTQVEFLPLPQTVADDNILMHQDGGGHHVLRNARTGQVIATLTPEEVNSVGQNAVSPDGSRFATLAPRLDESGRDAIEIYRVDSGKREAFVPFKGTSWHQLCFAPDGSKLLVGTSSSIEVLDLAKQTFAESWNLAPKPPATKEEAKGFSPLAAPLLASKERLGDFDESPARVLAKFAVSPKGVVAVGEMGGAVRLWDLNKREVLQVIEADEESPKRAIDSLAFSPDGRYLAYYVSGTLHLVDVSRVQPKASQKP